MRPDKTIAQLSPKEVIYIHCECGRDRSLMPITLLSNGKVKGRTAIRSLKKRLRCQQCGKRPKHVWIEMWKD